MKRLLMLLALAYAPAVFGHAEEAHPAPAFDPSSAEQTPFGIATDRRKAKRTIQVDMTEMRFAPAEVEVRQGDTVKFVVANHGKLLHEMVLGRMEDLKQHAEMMRKHPQMEHDEPHMVHVQPGKTGEMGWRFTEPGTFYYACLIPGHFEAGMVGKVTVAGASSAIADEPRDRALVQAPSGTMAEGVVRKVDKQAQKITLRHGPLPAFDMPMAMTMVYRVVDPALLDRVKAGDKVKFQAEKPGGVFTLTHIEPID